ncbi:AAA family ATPase [Carnobacterium divergens]|uniref:AAA family ATPase n=1 Tax=Carnobacterium divergens TaxID=2748 RepID=UPI002890C4D8|nr:AAA family ATPase [Carnobacterium divergens]MDT2010683.1 AAA family ATPase [Carnobacterium divergens]
MDNSTIKIKSIHLENIKNVCNGTIDFSDGKKQLNVLGVYGQNGSGKTALIDSLAMIRILMLGERLNSGEIDLLTDGEISKVDIEIQFNEEYEINYLVSLCKINQNVKILKEIMYMKKLEKFQRKSLIFEYSSSDEMATIDFAGKKDRPYNENERVKLLTAVALAEENETSFLFSDRIRTFINDKENKEIINPNLCQVVNSFCTEFARNLFLYSNKLSGIIYAEIFLPMSFQVDNASGLVPLPIDASEEIPESLYLTAKSIFEQINKVLPKLIPGLTVNLRVEDKSKNLDGETEYKVAVDSERSGNSIPFKKESDGIKKIVSILSTLINVYNSPNVIAAIDELDAGIFEFLLGEIVEVLSDDAKGQLIFTSHNLRALEILPYKKIVFTTTNSENRYIRVSNVKKTNNLRDMYIRAIQLGGMKEEVYQETDSYEIRKAFRKAFKKKIERTSL